MSESVLFGQGRHYTAIPRHKWEEHLSQVPAHDDPRHAFMTPAHHLVRNFVVRELPRLGQPMPPAFIAATFRSFARAAAPHPGRPGAASLLPGP